MSKRYIDPTQTLFSGVHLNKGKVPAVKSSLRGLLTTRPTCSFSFPLILFHTKWTSINKKSTIHLRRLCSKVQKEFHWNTEYSESHPHWQKKVLTVQESWSVSNWKKKTWQQLFQYFTWPVFWLLCYQRKYSNLKYFENSQSVLSTSMGFLLFVILSKKIWQIVRNILCFVIQKPQGNCLMKKKFT